MFRDPTREVIGAAIKIHRKLGPGLLESAYEACLAFELEEIGMKVERQKPVPLVYESVKLDCGFRADMIVDGILAVELKCKDALHPVDEAQVLSHMRTARHSTRFANQLPRSSSERWDQAAGEQLC
jgi:GxxExxY protein